MSKLLNYVNLIDENAAMREAHFANPSRTMTQYGLSKAEQQALASGNKNVAAEFAGADVDAKRVVVFVAAAVGQPIALAA